MTNAWRNFIFSTKTIWLIALWQLVTVYLMAMGALPVTVTYVSVVLIVGYIVLAGPLLGTLLLILSIPFSVVLPNPYFSSLPMWRPLFLVLLLVWLFHQIRNSYHRFSWNVLIGVVRSRLSRFPVSWNRWLFWFIAFASLSLFLARFPLHGFKQVLFLLNIGVLYIVVANVIKGVEDFKLILRYVFYSLAIMVGIGFLQFIASLFMDQFVFWQFWAGFVSQLYYGAGLAQVLSYSNSWFSAGSGGSLRMFGILPDTHAFAVIAMFALMYLIAQARIKGSSDEEKVSAIKQPPVFWIGVLVCSLALMLSGTRGAWVALVPVMILTGIFSFWSPLRRLVKMHLIAYALIILLFIFSPWISQGLNLIRSGMGGDHIMERAKSIYDLEETSNIGRLKIWRESAVYAFMHPLGAGYGNFIVSVIPEIPYGVSYEQISSSNNLLYNLPQKFITAHSLYLNTLVELGVVGLMIFTAIWLSFFRSLKDYFVRNSGQVSRSALYLASSGAMVSWLLAYGLFDLTMFNDRVLQYLALTMALSGYAILKISKAPQ